MLIFELANSLSRPSLEKKCEKNMATRKKMVTCAVNSNASAKTKLPICLQVSGEFDVAKIPPSVEVRRF